MPSPSGAPKKVPSCPLRSSASMPRRGCAPISNRLPSHSMGGTTGISGMLNVKPPGAPGPGVRIFNERSEEHTSELQSRLHLVCRLLLEKKKHQDALRAAIDND